MQQEKVLKTIKKQAPNQHRLTVSELYGLNLTAKLGLREEARMKRNIDAEMSNLKEEHRRMHRRLNNG